MTDPPTLLQFRRVMVSMQVEMKSYPNKPMKTAVWKLNAYANKKMVKFLGPLWKKKQHDVIKKNKMLQTQSQIKKDVSSVIFKANIKEICWNRHPLSFTFIYSITRQLA